VNRAAKTPNQEGAMNVGIDDLRQAMIEAGIETRIAMGVRPDEPLAKQGVDSIDFPAFAAALEERYRVKIEEKDSLSLRTLNDFAAYLSAGKK
jgi:acyl carrier protein